MGVKEEGLSSCIQSTSPSIPDMESSHEVTEVPRLAPIMTPIDCLSVISPEFTNPTTMTVVAEDD